jgi:hypothetical protein
MAYEQKPNTGSVFNNDRKETDNHPDRQGSALIECPHCNAKFAMWLNGWIKESTTKGKWLSLAFKPKEAAPARKMPAAKLSERGVSARQSTDDEIPF